jgi:K+-sensing histidine kinase KdpD
MVHLFDPFFQRGDDPQDLGTNLMACYHIVHLHGGHIEARNDFEGGHRAIHIYMPLSQSTPQVLSDKDLNSRIAATESLWRGLQRSRDQAPQI